MITHFHDDLSFFESWNQTDESEPTRSRIYKIKNFSSFSELAFDIISDLQKQYNYLIDNLIISKSQK